MLKKIFALAVVIVLLLVGTSSVNAGNGAPSGKHYTLNLLGKDWEKDEDTSFMDNNGHRIFVRLDGRTRIKLQEGDTFNVIDADGTDKNAKFQLPKPNTVVDDGGTPDDPSDDIVQSTEYYVYIRVLGKPSGWADMTSGFINESGYEWMSLETITLRQEGGKVNRKSPPKFVDVTMELTTIYVDITDDDIYNPQRYGLFDNELWEYFWDYDNHGLKHIQLRFYPVE
jgi:hypothetical protein